MTDEFRKEYRERIKKPGTIIKDNKMLLMNGKCIKKYISKRL